MAFTRLPRLSLLPTELRQCLLQTSTVRTYTTTPSTQHQQTPTTPSSSVNPTETTHFTALASSWWDPHGPSRILHLMNPLRHTFIKRCTSSIPASTTSSPPLDSPPHQQKKYLDIGCGGGIFAESAARLPTTLSVTAVDPTAEVISVARAHARRDPLLQEPGRLTYLNAAIEDLPLPTTLSDGVDVVSVFEVVEHVRSPSTFLENCARHVKPGGWLIGSTIARTWTSWLTTKVVAEDVLGIVPRGTHEWGQYINPEEMRRWAERQEGWGDWRVMGVVYVPGVGWKEVGGSEGWGNYFFGIRRRE